MTDVLAGRLADLGLGATAAVQPGTGGFAAEAFSVRLRSGREVVAKTLAQPPGEDVFDAEAEGLTALGRAGPAPPGVVAVGRDVLVLGRLLPRRDEPDAWERLAHDVAGLHAVTSPRFGWHRDGWLGTHRQVDTWEDPGHDFSARHRLLRWLPEPRLRAELDAADRAALQL